MFSCFKRNTVKVADAETNKYTMVCTLCSSNNTVFILKCGHHICAKCYNKNKKLCKECENKRMQFRIFYKP